MSDPNSDNISNSQPVNRHILISFGEALVGNIGGHNSSTNITALGTPVNILSRIDEITKNDNIRSLLDTNSLI